MTSFSAVRLTDFRALDTELPNACIDYLNYDRLGKVEVHTHLPDGGEQMQWFIAQHGIRRQVHLPGDEKHEARLHALAGRLDPGPEALLNEAVGDLLARYEGNVFGRLVATQSNADEGRPLVHARALADQQVKPLCGAVDGPWSARGFEFGRVTCWECQRLVLKPADAPA